MAQTMRPHTGNSLTDGIWAGAWLNWQMNSEECESPFVNAAMEWLFQSWGVYKWGQPGYDPALDIMPPLVYYKQQYFPTDIKVVNRVLVEDTAHYVSIYVDDHRVLYCLVMTIKYYEKLYAEALDDREFEFANMIDVFVDMESGMVVLI